MKRSIRLVEEMPELRARARHLTPSASDAEDLVQETLAIAVEREASVREPGRIRQWLASVQRNLHLNSRRALRARIEVADGLAHEDVASDDVGPEARLAAAALSPELRAALDALPEDWRQALWLREVDELSYAEIADVQRCPVGTVRSRLARAREAMQETLRRRGDHGRL